MNRSSVPDSNWQNFWFSTRQKAHWSSLSIVPNGAGLDVGRIAAHLVATGRLHGERTVSLMNAQGIHLSDVQPFIDTMEDMTAHGEWVVVAVDPLAQNPGALPIARATSNAVLVIRLGESSMSAARLAIKALGRERLLGSMVLDDTFDLG